MYCPRCGAITTLQREAYLADKSVTPHPLPGWEYVDPGGDFEEDGVRLVRGEHTDEAGCGEAFYPSFLRWENGEEVEPETIAEAVELSAGE